MGECVRQAPVAKIDEFGSNRQPTPCSFTDGILKTIQVPL